MDFFRSVFSDDPKPADLSDDSEMADSDLDSIQQSRGDEDQDPHESNADPDSNPDPNSNTDPDSNVSIAWSFGDLVKTLASRSESVIQTYRRDLDEFRSGLEKETAVIRDVARRAVKELPDSLEAGASAAQDSLESVGQAIDDLGSSVWRGTTEIISQGKETLLASDHDSDYSSDNSQQLGNRYGTPGFGSKRYCRFDAQVRAVQCDLNTYTDKPEDLSDFNQWKLGFMLDDEKGVEIENLFEENQVMEGIYKKLVPSTVDNESFWSRYFYRVHKLKQAEDARANLVKRAISGEEEELTWDVDDDEDDADDAVSELKSNPTREGEFENKNVRHPQGGSSEIECGEKSPKKESDSTDVVAEPVSDGGFDEKEVSETSSNKSVTKADEQSVGDGKNDTVESCKDSDISVVSTQPSLPEEVDLGWDEIEDIGSNDENKGAAGVSPNTTDLRKRLSVAEDDEDLSWDIEDDDEPAKS